MCDSDGELHSHCPYCSVQCAVAPDPHSVGENGRLRAVRGHPVALGRLCQKGFLSNHPVRHPDRIRHPLVRVNGALKTATWEEALDRVAEKMMEIQAESGPGAIGVYGGGSLTNEESYLLGKFARVALGTPFIDYNGRYCMSSAAAAMNKALGVDRGLPFPMRDIEGCRFVLLAGANIAECQPVMASHFARMRRAGGRLCVVDPRRTKTAAIADVHLAIRPGTDIIFFKGLLNRIVERGFVDQRYVDERTVGFSGAARDALAYPPSRVERETGIPVAAIEETARALALEDSAMILTARGVEQHPNGVSTVLAAINVALATGRVGRPNSGFGTITGQANGQGGREHGQKADQLPGYRSISDPEARARVARVWGVREEDLPGPGVSSYELFKKADAGEIRGMLVMASNPSVSSPNRSFVRNALEKLDYLVVCDLFLSETALLADVVLPGTAFIEKTGTVTNLEGRVLLRRRIAKAQAADGEGGFPPNSPNEMDILCRLADRLGAGTKFQFRDEEDVFRELCEASRGGPADYGGLTYARLEEEEGVFWPCPDPEHPGTKRMFERRFSHPDEKARFIAEDGDVGTCGQDLGGCERVLTTGRLSSHYLTGEWTRRTAELLQKGPRAFAEIHPDTARQIGVKDGEGLRVSNQWGERVYCAKVTEAVHPDLVFVPFHWDGDQAVNDLIGPSLDPVSRMPSFKRSMVALSAVKKTGPNGEREGDCGNVQPRDDEDRPLAHTVDGVSVF